MSLITSCPACGTMFRVVPDQLKISEGWVRCGHCAEVFDAAAHMADRLPPELAAEDPITEPAALEPAAAGKAAGPAAADLPPSPGTAPSAEAGFWDFTPPAARRGLEDAPPFVGDAPAAARPPVEVVPEPRGVAAAEPPRTQRPLTRPPWPSRAPAEAPSASLARPEAPVEPVVPSPAPPQLPGRPAAATVQAAAAGAAPTAPSPLAPADAAEGRSLVAVGSASRPVPLQGEDAEREPDIGEVSFVRQARRRAFWRSPVMRTLLALLMLALGGLLAAQVAYQDRDRLALIQPALKPALEQMCQLLACRLAPPRQIDAIVIDSSGFNRLRADTYRLSFALRNTAAVEVAVPAIELTLTDMQDQPVLRRVLTADELGAAQPVIPAASEWAGAVGLTVQANGTRIAGYRLLAFYP